MIQVKEWVKSYSVWNVATRRHLYSTVGAGELTSSMIMERVSKSMSCHAPPRYFAKLLQFEQHFEYFTVFLRKNTPVKRESYLIHMEMW